jgi:hypothetical protein
MAKKNGRRSRDELWKWQGGGCMVGRFAKGKEYPCDEEYLNTETGEQAILSTTAVAHASMPDTVACIRELARRPGVKLYRRGWFGEKD